VLLGDSNDSGCERSSTDDELLILARLREVTSDSGCIDCTTSKDNSSQAIPKKKKAAFKQVVPLGASNKLGLERPSTDAELPILARLRKVAGDSECTDCATNRTIPS
jgi:phage gp16-like protein